jgi:two-component system, chemotaxis family, protein-glutamate methylesterase/glutaminase
MSDGDPERIRVLVVDDSALMSRQITSILQEDSSIEVVGRAKDGIEALAMVRDLNPDVVTLDVEMPRMNGITALKHIMVKHATPTLMISALTKEGARTTFDALRYGAIDVIAKPSRREDENLDAQKADIVAKVRRAAAIRSGRSKYIRMTASQVTDKVSKGDPDSGTRFIGVGAGTGGYYGLLRIIPALSKDFSDIIIATVLVASRYTDPFVAYLDAHSAVPVRNAKDVGQLRKGACYISSGDDCMNIGVNGDGYLKFGFIDQGKTGYTGPIDMMLGSLAEVAGSQAVGIIMTGAGQDGAVGLSEIKKRGGRTLVQDINNCMDPSMPLAALEKGSVEKVIPDYMMAEFIMNL